MAPALLGIIEMFFCDSVNLQESAGWMLHYENHESPCRGLQHLVGLVWHHQAGPDANTIYSDNAGYVPPHECDVHPLGPQQHAPQVVQH